MSRGISISGLSVADWASFKALRRDLRAHRAEHGTGPGMKGPAELIVFRAGLESLACDCNPGEATETTDANQSGEAIETTLKTE